MDGFWHFKRHFGAVMKMSDSMSADVYSDLTNGLVLKNYPKMTPDTLRYVQKLWRCLFPLPPLPLDWP